MVDSSKLKIAFIHPDLGIGGAERLVVDAAVGLQGLGHSVEIITSHHDPSHSFEETNDGTLKIRHVPTIIPRHVGGALHIYLAVLRQLHLLTTLIASHPDFDVYVVDQLSACIPFLRWATGKRVVFYCHFPDKLLASGKEAVVDGSGARMGLTKRLYRLLPDTVEEWSTGHSDVILANSQFTANVFKKSFPRIAARKPPPEIVYPGINLSAYNTPIPSSDGPGLAQVASDRPSFISLNRFEHKKNVALAVEAFSLLLRENSGAEDVRLVVGGGYDPRLKDNIETLSGLRELCQERGLTYSIIDNGTKVDVTGASQASGAQVVFILNFTTTQRQYLLKSNQTLALLYTPGNEHFGIGPVEAMACGLPVVACTSGGPTESLVDVDEHPQEGIAWLRDPDPEAWCDALEAVLGLSEEEKRRMGERAKKRASDLFSMEQMTRGFLKALEEAVDKGPVVEGRVIMSRLKISFGIAGLVGWLKFNGMDLLGGPLALMGLLALAVLWIRL